MDTVFDLVWPNQPDAANPAIASPLHSGYRRRGLADPEYR
ncbi:MAG: hypothetical protein JWM68_2039 [Verrucomicrobiales bacterium]|nr:hypothetical protein [Verrucomicrobiales bacterium]